MLVQKMLISLHRSISMAVCHYHHRLLSQCLSVWVLEMGRERGRREREREETRHRDKVQAFLTAAAAAVVSSGGGEEGEGEDENSGEAGVEDESPNRGEGKKRDRGRESSKSDPVIWQTARRRVVSLLQMRNGSTFYIPTQFIIYHIANSEIYRSTGPNASFTF